MDADPALAPTDAARPHLVLVGMMGAGKSSVARHLARCSSWHAVDIDADIERAAGCSVAALFAAEGEAAFRAREATALAGALAAATPSVIATGGGAVLRPASVAAMRARGTVVWLRARPDTLASRVGGGAGRPLLAGDPIGALTRLAAERSPAYGAAAHAVIDVDGQPFSAVVQQVLRLAGAAVSP